MDPVYYYPSFWYNIWYFSQNHTRIHQHRLLYVFTTTLKVKIERTTTKVLNIDIPADSYDPAFQRLTKTKNKTNKNSVWGRN